MMRYLLAAAITLAGMVANAPAADLPPIMKAPPRILMTYQGRGCYYGAETFAQNDRIKASQSTGVIGGTLGGTFEVGGAVGVMAGCLWGDGVSWKAIEVAGTYKNISATPVMADGSPAAFDSRWGMTERFLIGGPITRVLDLLPNVSSLFPVLPVVQGGVGTTHPYLFAAAHQDLLKSRVGFAEDHAWAIRGGFGMGFKQQVTSGLVMDVWAEYIPAGGSTVIGSAAAKNLASVGQGRETRIGVGLAF